MHIEADKPRPRPCKLVLVGPNFFARVHYSGAPHQCGNHFYPTGVCWTD